MNGGPNGRRRLAERVPTAVAGLALADAGAAIPFGISDLDGNPNAVEWGMSILFAAMVVAIAAGLLWNPIMLRSAANTSGVLWAGSAIYILVNADLDWQARVGLALIFVGIAAGCFGLAHRLANGQH